MGPDMIPLLLAVLSLPARAAGSQDQVPYPTYNCDATSYYNPIDLTCTALVDGYTVEEGAQQCTSTYQSVYSTSTVNCSLCNTAANEMASEAKTSCIKCPGSLAAGICDCDYTKEILIDTEQDGTSKTAECLECSSGFRPGAKDSHGVPRECVECEHVDCTCDYSAGYCFKTNELSTNVDTFVESGGTNIQSKVLKDNLAGVYQLCLKGASSDLNNVTACQILANLCTSLYSSYDLNLVVKTACELLLAVESAIGGTGDVYLRPGWYKRVPWIFYQTNNYFRTNEQILEETVAQTYTFESNLDTSKLDIYVVSYSSDGEALPIAALSTQLSPCTSQSLSFGTEVDTTCSYTASELLSLDDGYHELYLRISGDVMYPIPVLVENSNTDTETADWKLTRRFFILDSTLGIQYSDNERYFLRYASSLSLTVTVAEGGTIYTPLLRVTYSDLNVNEQQGSTVALSFSVRYQGTVDDFENDLGIAIGVTSFLGLLWAVIKTVSYRRRNHIVEDCSCTTLTSFLLYLAGCLGMLFFWALTGTSWYYLIIYKGQRAVSLFLPIEEGPFTALLTATFFLLLLHRLTFLFNSTSYDIFFVDWEKPKGKFIPSSTSTKEEAALTTVSIWRTYFLANEWNELHTIRKINPTLQYIALIFLTEYVGFKYLATKQPDAFLNPSSVTYVSESSPILRVGLVTAISFTLWIIQRIWNFLYERFISDQVQMYVDLCSISNISVFILSDQVYGHYIHGRAVHGHADSDMREMTSALRREEENLCSKRGLGPDSDQQTFDMVVPILLRTNYNRVTLPLRSRDISNRGQTSDLDKQIAAYHHINRLIASYIDHSLDDIDYTIGEKLFMERLLDMEIREPPAGTGLLYPDEGQSFESVLYYGNEWLLFVWEVLFIATLDHWTGGSFVLASTIAWLFNEVILNTFSKWRCQRNVAAKALIDERFLL